MKCKNKWIWNMFKWTFFYFHLLPLDKWDWCKTGTLNVHSWAIKVIANRRFWINYKMKKKKKSVHLATKFQRRRFRNRSIRNKNCLWWPCLLTNREKMSILYRGPSIDASYQVSIHLAKQFQRGRFFRNRPIRNKNYLWPPCLYTNRPEMSILNRGPPIYASYQVSVHLANWFQRRRYFRNPPIRNKHCQWPPCLLTNRAKMNTLHRGPYIDASY
jgi:hypothetical protein